MCLQLSAVRPYQKWHWAGDEIVYRPVVPAARFAAGSRKRDYDIDIREYLSIDNNYVVQSWLQQFVKALPQQDEIRFHRHDKHSFDFRANVIVRAMARLRHRPTQRKFDQWLFPDETIATGGGDCEDLAFLLAASLIASGISPDCVRVALGTIVDHSVPNAPHAWDHAWVMYLRENGAWQILEPLAKIQKSRSGKQASSGPQDVEYVPHFVFNSSHLWRVRGPESRADARFSDYLASRPKKFWASFNPAFAAGTHADIFDLALVGMTEQDLELVKGTSLGVDINVLAYDPRDHFDFAYIDQSWDRVESRLASRDLVDFALASHAIADFYAHSVYGHFVERKADGTLPIYDRSVAFRSLDYRFLQNEPRPGSDDDDFTFAQRWQGKLISGQWWRWYTTYPSELKGEVQLHRCLPDHDRLAVDSPHVHHAGGHALYPNPQDYEKQFNLRKAAAVEHIRSVFATWR